MRRGSVEFDAWALFANEGMIIVRYNRFGRTNGEPLSQLHIAEGADLRGCRRLGLLRLDCKVELAVIEHLGPQAAINERADMFDEHAILVNRYRLSSLLDIDFDF